MVLDLKQIFDVVGESKVFAYDLDLTDYELYNTKPFTTPVHIEGEVRNRAGVVEADFTTTFVLELACDRCLTSFTREYALSFSEVIVNDDRTNDDEYIAAEDGMLDMDVLAVSDILLDLPSKQLCSEDCKGLCPVCGVDLNHSVCQCQKKEIDPRLQILSGLLQ